MILVCGTVADVMVELMCARLNDLGYEYLFLDQLYYPGRFHISWEPGIGGPSGFVASSDRKVDFTEITGVYASRARAWAREGQGLSIATTG
jgi:hypothetical protein